MEVLIMKYTLKDKKTYVDNATTFKGTTLEYCRLNNYHQLRFINGKKNSLMILLLILRMKLKLIIQLPI